MTPARYNEISKRVGAPPLQPGRHSLAECFFAFNEFFAGQRTLRRWYWTPRRALRKPAHLHGGETWDRDPVIPGAGKARVTRSKAFQSEYNAPFSGVMAPIDAAHTIGGRPQG